VHMTHLVPCGSGFVADHNDGGTRARESPGGHLSGRAVVDQLDQLYEDSAQSGRIMALALHPFVIGNRSATSISPERSNTSLPTKVSG
jgi:hypothetical protein